MWQSFKNISVSDSPVGKDVLADSGDRMNHLRARIPSALCNPDRLSPRRGRGWSARLFRRDFPDVAPDRARKFTVDLAEDDVSVRISSSVILFRLNCIKVCISQNMTTAY